MNNILIKKFNIKGLYLIKPKIYSDGRGYFFESYNKNKYKKINIKTNFVQDDHSFSKKNVLRGIHFQYKRPQAQLIYLAKGKIYLVLVDFRPKSKTFLNNISLILDSKMHYQIYMPPGVGSGFYSLANENHLIYKISEIYRDNKNEIGVFWKDKDLNIKWPCKRPLISIKDKANMMIKDIKFMNYKDLLKL